MIWISKIQNGAAIEHDPVHPLNQIARAMVEFELSLSEVRYWHVPEQMPNKSVRSRQILLREVMRPASRTWQWRRLAIDESELSPSSLQGLKVISVTDSFQEAELIAGLMRKTLETPNKTAMLVTPDRMLARKVQAALMRWNITVDDLAGSSHYYPFQQDFGVNHRRCARGCIPSCAESIIQASICNCRVTKS